MTDITLVVLQHGLWGKSSHMSYIERSLVARLQDDPTVVVLNSKVNEGKYTYDGVDLCGQRLADKIRSYVKELANDNKSVKKLSMVGYSLGGLITRFTIGLLDQEGFFNGDIKPGFFVTFATPHMGVRRPKTSLFSRTFNFLSGHMVSRTGKQLQLIDDFNNGTPLLVILASPDYPYYQALQKFDTIRTYANIKNDRTVPYWTAAFMTVDYFDNLETIDLTIHQEYPSIVTGCDLVDKTKKTTNRRREPTSEKVRKALIYLLGPPLFPLVLIIAFMYVGIQGMLSRIRVSKILAASLDGSASSTATLSPPVLLPTPSSSSASLSTKGHDKHQSAQLLSGALDVINITIDDDDIPAEHKSTSHPRDNWSNVVIPETIKKQSSQYQFDSHVVEIHQNLTKLPWQTVLVCLHTFNSHGGIVCRQGIHTTSDGKAVIEHFLDTVSF
ncbi:putative serine esterase-domain-containing protein [Chlamydoabsidia padenii]|nr:putative serine esterase-domain-containing protein [Chlamydoabsidia padenii]